MSRCKILIEKFNKMNEVNKADNITIAVTDSNNDQIQKLFKKAKSNVISGEIENATYDMFLSGVKKDNLGTLNIEIKSEVDSPTMQKKYRKEILNKVLGIKEELEEAKAIRPIADDKLFKHYKLLFSDLAAFIKNKDAGKEKAMRSLIKKEMKKDGFANSTNLIFDFFKVPMKEELEEAGILDGKHDIGDSIVKYKFKGFSMEKLGKAEYLDDNTTLVLMYARLVDSNGFYVNDGKAETATGEGFIISTLPTEDDIYKAHRWVKGTYKPIMIKDNGTANLLRETTKEAKKLAKKL